MRIDLRHERLQLDLFFTRLLRLHLFDQLGNLRTHPVKAVDQQIRLVPGPQGGRNRHKNPLLHPLHTVHRTDNAAHQPADKVTVEQKGRHQGDQHQHHSDIADLNRLRGDQLARRNGDEMPILVVRRQIGNQRFLARVFIDIIAFSVSVRLRTLF
ncbi:hypothetical protein D1872_232420 [compost metagenome]